MKTVAILQARMQSHRLPGKVLMPIGPKTVIEHCLARLQRCCKLDEIIVATTTSPADNILEALAYQQGVHVFRGSQDNLLDRYYNAALQANADYIIRVTSDCPFLDPLLVDETVIALHKLGTDCIDSYTSTDPRLPRGLDSCGFTFKLLELAHQNERSSFGLEHVTPYFSHGPNANKRIDVGLPAIDAVVDIKNSNYAASKNSINDTASTNPQPFGDRLRWTVDEKDDLEAMRILFQSALQQGFTQNFLWTEGIQTVLRNPAIIDINKHVIQKA